MRAFVTKKTSSGIREKRMIQDAPDPPAPGPNEVKVRTRFTGMTNGTERNDLIGGNYATPDEALPRGMGYQNVGEIIELGSAVMGLSVGDLVYSGTWLASDHADLVTVPAQDFERFAALVPVPEGVDLADASLFGVASVAVRACRAADIRLGEDILVVGLGLLGQLVVQVAKAMGGRVTACEVNPRRLEIARTIGKANVVIDTSGDNWALHIEAEGYDKVIDVAGVRGMEDQLLDAVRVLGTVLFIAGRQRVDYDFNIGQFKEVSIRQIAHFDASDLHIAADLCASGAMQIRPLIQQIVDAEACGDVYDTLRDRPDDLMGVVFSW